MTKITETIAAINTRTMGNRRIEQAKARLTNAEEAIQFERELIAAFSLDEGQWRPALSLYVTARRHDGEILSTDTRLEPRGAVASAPV